MSWYLTGLGTAHLDLQKYFGYSWLFVFPFICVHMPRSTKTCVGIEYDISAHLLGSALFFFSLSFKIALCVLNIFC